MAKNKNTVAEPAETTTEIEAPYELPEGWKWYRLGDVADWGSGGTPSRKNPEYYKGIIPWIKTGELNESYIYDSEEKISEDAIKNSSAKLFPKETVALAMYGATIGKTAIFGIEASTNQACACAICHKDLDNHYLFQFLKSKKDYFISSGKGGAQPNISQEIIKNTIIPLPPTLEEQQRIVNRIETLFAKLDQAKEKAQNVVDTFETRKAAILHQAFNNQLKIDNGKLKDEDWIETTIGECGNWYGGGTPNTAVEEYWKDGSVLWITSKDMKSDYIEDTQLHVTQTGIDNSSAKLIQEPAVLFVMRSGILRRTFPVCMVEKEFTVNQDLKALVPFANVNLKFLFYYCKAEEKKILNECMKNGTTVESINAQSLMNLKIKLPPINYQLSIVNFLDTILEKETKAKESAEAVLEQIDLLKKSILARAFRGEL